MNKKAVIQYILVGLLIIASFLLGSLYTKVAYLEKGKGSAANVPVPTSAPQAPAAEPTVGDLPQITNKDHVRGSRNARIALIEYSDTECPFSKRYHPTAQQAFDTYNGKVMWVYRHYPLAMHVNAQKEAEATECANELGGNDMFWRYIDAIYDRTSSNGTGYALDQLVPLAKEFGLNEATFKNCLDSGKYTQSVKDDLDGGTRAGVTGTPGTILLDTKTGKTALISGAVPFEQLKQSIDEMLKV